ncbi:MAG: LPXTG cell wall anchor domain-containing protein [Acidimicrobiia bacterium]
MPVDPAHTGSECEVTITGENNSSVHPNTDIFIASETEVVALDVERAAGAVTTPAGTLRLADTITVSVRLGEDGVFSGGFLRASFACEPPPPPPPPPTTVAAPTTAPNVPVGAEVLEQQPCQPAGSDTSGSAAANGQSERCAGTLPRTGSSTAGAVVAGTASVIVGFGLLASHRRRRAARLH